MFLHRCALVKNYRKYTKSVSFMWRVFLLFWLFSLPGLNKFQDVLNKKLRREYIFTTPFWKFIGRTSNARSVMQEDYELETKKVLLHNAKKYNSEDKYFLNIWTHVGRRAIDLAKNYNYQGVCFEPSPETFKSLKVNAILSDVESKLRFYNLALGDEDSTMKFVYQPSHDWGSHIVQTDEDLIIDKDSIHINVPVKKLDSLIDEELLKKTRLVLIDVEWFELNVLKGARESLKTFKNIDIVMEIFHYNPKKKETIAFMEELGYSSKKIGKDDRIFSKE